MALEMMPLLDIVLVLVGFYFVGSPAMVKVLASAHFVFWATITLVLYIINVCCFSAFIIFLSTLFMAICSLLQYFGCHTASYNHILQRIEKKIQAQLSALRAEEHKAAAEIKELLESIEQWDLANADLMRQIRDAEYYIQKRDCDYEPVPKRVKTPKQGGVTVYSRPPREPSAWALVRWWRGEDAPVVFEAGCDLEWIHARLSTVRGCHYGFVYENDKLTEALREVTARRRAVESDPMLTAWGARYIQYTRQLQDQMRRQPPPKVHSRDFVRQPLGGPFWRRQRAIEENGEMLHACYDCGNQSHPWVYQYSTIAAAAQSNYHDPCPAARARRVASGSIWAAAVRRPIARGPAPLMATNPFHLRPFAAPAAAAAVVPVAAPAAVPVAAPAAAPAASPVAVPAVAAPIPTTLPVSSPVPAAATIATTPVAATPAPVPGWIPTTPPTPSPMPRSVPAPPLPMPATPGPSTTTTATKTATNEEKGGLVSPTASELGRELAQEEAARMEKEDREREKKEKEEKRKKKGKERMGRREEEELERERAERDKYRQRF